MHVAVIAFMPLVKLLFSLPIFCNLNMLLYTESLLRPISAFVQLRVYRKSMAIKTTSKFES
jgi:hypothetical protein